MKKSDLGRFCKVLALVCVWALSGATAAHAQFRLPKIPKIPGLGTKGKSQPTKTTEPQPEQAKPEQDLAQSSMGQEMPDGTIAVWVEKNYGWDNALHSEFSINGTLVNIFTSNTIESIAEHLKPGWNTIAIKTTPQEPANQNNHLRFRIGPMYKDEKNNRMVMHPVLWEFDNGTDWKLADGKYSHPLGPHVKEVTLTYRVHFADFGQEQAELQAGDFVLSGKGNLGDRNSPVIATVFVNGTPLPTFMVASRQAVITPFLKQGKNEIKIISARVPNVIQNNDVLFEVAGPAEWNVTQGSYELGRVIQFGSMQGWRRDPRSGMLVNLDKPEAETIERVIPFFLKQAPAAASKAPSQPAPEASQAAEETSEATKREPERPRTPPAGTEKEEMITLPNGRTMPWARYEEQFNDQEKKFNALGHSLKDKSAQPVVLERPKMDRTALGRQTSRIAAMHLRLQPPPPNFQQEIKALKTRRQKGGTASQEGGIASQVGTITAPVAQDVMERITQERWELPMGDPDTFYVNLSGDLTLSGSTAHTKSSARTAADCSIMNQRLPLVQVNAVVDSPKSAEMTGSVELKVLGNSFTLLDEKSLTLFEKEGEKSDRVDYGYKTRFSVGPVPMSVTVGARGEAGVKYYVRLQPGAAAAVVTPFVDTEAYVEVAGVDVEIASAGVGGAMKLVKDELVLKADLSLQVDPSGKPYIWQDYSAQNMMDTLSGRLYLFAKVYVCELGPPPHCGNKEFRKELWDWEGFQTNDYLFRKTAETYLQ